jgi:tRNA(fMet)-specific endonuclease VapC
LNRFLLDTNVVSEPLRPKPNRILIARLREHETELALPSIVWHELLFGCASLPVGVKRTAIEDYLNSIPWIILPYDSEAAEWHAQERARLQRLGKTPTFPDGQIAAIAVTQKLTLVTLNRRDFQNFKGVNLADWTR